MRGLRLLLVFLAASALALPGCPQPSADDDDAADDDDITTDDDDSGDDDDDDDDDDDATPAPSTTLTILSPAPGAPLQVLQTFRAQIDGDAPGIATFRIDGDVVAQGFFNVATGVFEAEIDTGAYPDGAYTFEAEASQWGLTDSAVLSFENGDLLRYDYSAVPYTYQAQFPVPSPLTLVPPAVSLLQMVSPQPGDPYAALFGYALNPDGDWAIGGPETTVYPIGSSIASPWAGGIPNHPNVDWLTGAYNLYPWADESGDGNDFDVTALVKRSFGPVQAGLLHVDFYFGASTSESAASAQSSANFQGFLDALEGVFLQADIGLGDIGYYDLGPASPASISNYSDLVELFDSGIPSDDRVLNVFVVSDMNMPGSNPLGVASHIPGPALMNGEGQSGVAMVDDYIQSGEPGTAASLAAHEMSHYLGLYHGTEVGGLESDPLNDTPAACNGGGCWATNLMDPYLYGNTSITPDQRWVLLRHALVELVPASRLPARSDASWIDGADGLPPGGFGAFCGVQ